MTTVREVRVQAAHGAGLPSPEHADYPPVMPLPDTIDPDAARAAKAFVDRLRQRHPDAQALLFGSRLRGDQHSESDVDIAVVLPQLTVSRLAEGQALADIAFDVLLETGVLVAPLPLSRAELSEPSRFGNPALIESIRREGVAL
jgi:uncharacterized protein